MRPIYHIASEFTPLAKAGGMGDAVYGLVKEQFRLGARLSVVLPYYFHIDLKATPYLKMEIRQEEGKPTCTAEVFKAFFEDIPIYLIKNDRYFHRDSIYRQPDDAERFLYFSTVAISLIRSLTQETCTIHCHDWHTAAATAALEEHHTVLTIHNLKYKGECTEALLRQFCYPTNPFVQSDGSLNLLHAGLTMADVLVTVSPTYAKEILTPPFDCGFGALLKKRQKHLHGILNGIDMEYWSPHTDLYLDVNYTPDNQEIAKRQNRQTLQKEFGMQAPHGPLYCCITRFDPQKGPELIAHGIEKALKLGGQFFLLGASTHPDCDPLLKKIKATYHTNTNVTIFDGFNERLSHRLFAAADFILIPSLFEPCGLTQLIGMRYGTLPIVHHTGGLTDTVINDQNGFTFHTPTNRALGKAMERAHAIYDSSRHLEIKQHAMARDSSWTAPAKQYLALYTEMNSKLG